MYYLNENDILPLARGCAILGSGGGGNPHYDQMTARSMIRQFGPVPILNREELQDDQIVAPIAFMGAPLICLEHLPNGKEFQTIFSLIEQFYGKRPVAIMPAEIGGGNGIVPIWVSHLLKVPVVDADTLGRAFPELQMSSCNLLGIHGPAFLADSLGNAVTIHAKSAKEMEHFARNATLAFGSNAAIACYIMTGKEVKAASIKNSISRAISLGKKTDFSEQEILGRGKIIDVSQNLSQGFLYGSFTIDSDIQVLFQNEYLMVLKDGAILASTPDIIMAIEQDSKSPITSESIKFGLRVELIRIEAPDLWKTPEGLALTGPQYFNLNR